MPVRSVRFSLALLLALGVAATAGVIDAAPAAAQSNSKGAANTQRDKKPGQSCQGIDQKSQAYADCVKAEAQTTKTDKQGVAGSPGKPK